MDGESAIRAGPDAVRATHLPVAPSRITDVIFIVIGLGFVAISALGLGSYPAIAPWYWPIDIALGLIATGLLWWSRSNPIAVAALLIIPGTISICAGFAALAGVYRLGSYAPPRFSLPLVGLHLVLALPYHAVAPVPGMTWLTWLIVIPLLYLLSISFGLLSRARRQLIEGIRRSALADRERFDAELATLRRDERELIAREMHDVLAHRISLLSVHAGALEFRTRPASDSEPITTQDVHEAATVIRENAHLAVEELRELLLILRKEEATVSELTDSRPQPNLGDVHALMDEARQAGQVVDLAIDERAVRNTRASVQRTAYRIVQEGLTNARKHAPHSPVSIVIRSESGHLHVEVRNPVPLGLTATEIPGASAGLAGLTERVRIDGGQLWHGLDDGVFALAVDLPEGRL